MKIDVQRCHSHSVQVNFVAALSWKSNHPVLSAVPISPSPSGDMLSRTAVPMEVNPWLLIAGSSSLAGVARILSVALCWSDPLLGLPWASLSTCILLLPMIAYQVWTATSGLMDHCSAKWRAFLLLSPAVLSLSFSIWTIVDLYPHEKRARNELREHIGGPLPPSLRNVELNYRGGAEPLHTFRFNLSHTDFESIGGYYPYLQEGAAGERVHRIGASRASA